MVRRVLLLTILLVPLALSALAPGAPPRGFADAMAAWKSRLDSGLPAFLAMAPPAPLAYLEGPLHYDALNAAYQARKLTRNRDWDKAVAAARYQWRDLYVLPNGGGIPGWRQYTAGLRADYEATGSIESRDAVYLISRGGYSSTEAVQPGWAHWGHSREIALAILAMLDADALGLPLPPGYAARVDLALGHLDQWFNPDAPQPGTGPMFNRRFLAVQSFMVGITLRALIAEYERSHDPRIPPRVKMALDGLWATWIPGAAAFPYWDRDTSRIAALPDLPPQLKNALDGKGQPKPAPDLNPIIGPAFAWYAQHSGDPEYRRRYEQIFAGSTMVRSGYPGAKQFNQALWWEPQGLAWHAKAARPPARADQPQVEPPPGRASAPRPAAAASAFVAEFVGRPEPGKPAKLRVTLEAPGDTPVAPTFVLAIDGYKGGKFTPARVVLSAERPSAELTYTPPKDGPADALTLTLTAGPGTAKRLDYPGPKPGG